MFVRLVIPNEDPIPTPKLVVINNERILLFEVEDWFGAHTPVKGRKELWDFRTRRSPEQDAVTVKVTG